MAQASARPPTQQRGTAREVESLLWLAAGAAWAVVALRAWTLSKRTGARRRTQAVSERLLTQVFPDGIAR